MNLFINIIYSLNKNEFEFAQLVVLIDILNLS